MLRKFHLEILQKGSSQLMSWVLKAEPRITGFGKNARFEWN